MKKDFVLIEEAIDENMIGSMTVESFKNNIKSKIREAALKHLRTIQATHEKVRAIQYENLEIKAYMLSPLFSSEEVTNLALLRSHSVRSIKKNFSSWYKPNLACPLGCLVKDNQNHLLQCGPLLEEVSTEQKEAVRSTYYEDIYGSLEQQKAAIVVFSRLLKAQERLLEAVTPASGASLDAAPVGGDGVHVNVIH